MTDIKLIPGKKYWVAVEEEGWGWGRNSHRVFAGYHDTQQLFAGSVDGDRELYHWPLAREIEPETPKHYTAETFPKGEVWIEARDGAYYLVTGFSFFGIESTHENLDFDCLAEFKISTDGRRTWRKAVPGSE